MKILYLHPRSWTGEYPMLVQLQRMGHQVFVLEENRKLTGARSLTPDFEQPGDGIATFWYNPRRGIERVLTWPWDRYFRKAFDGRNLAHRVWIIAAAARHFQPDLVIASDGFSYAVPASYARRFGWLTAPLVVSFIGGDILDCPEADVGRRRTKMVSRLMRNTITYADILRPVSPLVEDLLRSTGANQDRIRLCPSHLVAPQGELDRIHARKTHVRTAIRNDLSIPLDARVIITLSGNLKGKGLHVLAEAWPKIRAAIDNVYWLFCGPTTSWVDEVVWPRLLASGTVANIIVTDTLVGKQVFEYLAAANLHINPSLCESLNMVTVEAAAVGTPTVGTDGAGIAAWVVRFSSGATVPAGQPGPLADAIISALNNPSQLDAWSVAGRAMSTDFALDHVAEQLVSIFEQARTEH